MLLRPSKRKPPAEAGIDLLPAPAALQVTPAQVRVGDGYTATFAVCGYPAAVGPAWLDPLLSYPGRVDVAVHIDPVPAVIAAGMLKKQRARLESTRRLDAEGGKLGDPAVDAAATDAADLAERVARGAAKLFRTGIYLTVHARTLDELADACAGVRSAAAGVLLDLQPATFRHHLGYATTLPLGVDGLGMTRILDTDALAAAFPLAGADLPAPAPGQIPAADAVLYGVNTTSAGVLLWNRWAQDNHNSVVLARSGAGKSYFVKLEVLRCLYQGVQVAVIDPEDEYTALAEHVGGTVIALGQPNVKINPLDLPADNRPDTMTRRGLTLHTMIAVMLGTGPDAGLNPAEQAALDRAITATYHQAGITTDPATWQRPAPLLRDLAATLEQDSDEQARQLATRLSPWVSGAYSTLFDAPTTTPPGGHLVVWSLRHLPDELRTIGTLLALDAIWRDIDTPADPTAARRRLVVVDEAWLLMRDGHGARFLFRMAKAARKRAAGLTVVTQDAADVLGSDLGLAVVSNASTQILMRQAPQSIDAVTEAFRLTAGEARLLLASGKGEGLLVAGRSRVPFQAVASPSEHDLCLTGIGADQ
jgi:type IV secretory pathway VirB4 component